MAVLQQVRSALAEAHATGQPRPGRPTLVKLTGATDHQVRRALAELATKPDTLDNDHDSPGDITDNEASASDVTTEVRETHQPRPWPLLVIGLAAAIAVWGGWVELGRLTGFGVVHPLPGLWEDLRINTAIVLPLGIEAYGGYALRTWLSSADLSERTRRFARWSAIASLVVGAGAQVASHLMKAANVTSAPPLVTVLVACVPVLVLGLATGLATLVKRDTTAGGMSSPGFDGDWVIWFPGLR
ncbi:hypothetical protein [Actinokineospora sp.]|uniref:hypothetical protein n=1 Tax=Actinokineospora sp. TaxID=1872133 RepID=UPI003D6BCB23